MSRGVRKSTSEKLETIDSEILELEEHKSKLDSKIKDLKDQKQELLNQVKLEQASKLLDAMEASGISPEEALAKLTGKSNSQESA